MFKKLSLRIKITLISTLIMILVAVVLTIFSVFKASSGFLSMAEDIEMSYPTYESDMAQIIQSEGIQIQPIEERKLGNVNFAPINNMIATVEVSPQLAVTTLKAADRFMWSIILYMFIIIIIGAILIYIILGKVLIPVKRLSTEVGIINENKLSLRIEGFNNGDEISELASEFNEMLDRLDKAFENQKRFSSDAAHELKTPLTALKANLDILEMDKNPSDEDYKRIVCIFKKQTERMINLVNNLFALSAQKDYEFNDKIDLTKIINDILTDLDLEIRDKNINVNFDKSDIKIQGNLTMITHAISNVIQNAIKYNNEGGSISILSKEQNDNCIIRVIDNGIGIPKEKANHIFDAFYRVDGSRSRKTAGAGLGLAITNTIVSSHGGKIKYFPNDAGGSIFEIKLPLINNKK